MVPRLDRDLEKVKAKDERGESKFSLLRSKMMSRSKLTHRRLMTGTQPSEVSAPTNCSEGEERKESAVRKSFCEQEMDPHSLIKGMPKCRSSRAPSFPLLLSWISI